MRRLKRYQVFKHKKYMTFNALKIYWFKSSHTKTMFLLDYHFFINVNSYAMQHFTQKLKNIHRETCKFVHWPYIYTHSITKWHQWAAASNRIVIQPIFLWLSREWSLYPCPLCGQEPHYKDTTLILPIDLYMYRELHWGILHLSKLQIEQEYADCLYKFSEGR